ELGHFEKCERMATARFPASTRGMRGLILKPRCKPHAKAIGIQNGEVTQTVFTVGDRREHLSADGLRTRPERLNVGHHHAHVRPRSARTRGKARLLVEEQLVTLPGEHDEGSAIFGHFESELLVEGPGAGYVADHNLHDELLYRRDVRGHD